MKVYLKQDYQCDTCGKVRDLVVVFPGEYRVYICEECLRLGLTAIEQRMDR